MSIDAQIDAAVTAFVAELTVLVGRAALESVRAALVGPALPVPAKGAALQRIPSRRSRPASAPPGAVDVGSPPSARPASPPPLPPVVVQRIPPKKPRRVGVRAAAAPPPVRASVPEPVSAKNWVVVRRPARGHGGSAPDVEAGVGRMAGEAGGGKGRVAAAQGDPNGS